MKALSKEQRNRLWLVAAASVVVLAAIWFGLVGSLSNQLAGQKKQIKEQEDKLANAQRLVREKNNIEQSLLSADAKLKAIEQTMAAGDMYAWIIQTITRFRADYRVDIPQFSREITGDVGVLPNYPYKAAVFSVRGTAFYHDLGKFVAGFENAYPYARLQNFEIEAANPINAGTNGAAELLAFKMDIVSLINPNPL